MRVAGFLVAALVAASGPVVSGQVGDYEYGSDGCQTNGDYYIRHTGVYAWLVAGSIYVFGGYECETSLNSTSEFSRDAIVVSTQHAGWFVVSWDETTVDGKSECDMYLYADSFVKRYETFGCPLGSPLDPGWGRLLP